MSEGPEARGWRAIDAALRTVYGEMKPNHWGPILSARIGGPDPLDGISAFSGEAPPHWHYVTYGMTELYDKESDIPESSGWGFEFTFRLAPRGSAGPPTWVLDFLNNLARYVNGTGNVFEEGDHMDLNGPIALGQETAIRAALFVRDPQLADISTPNGAVKFLQVVGVTLDEWRAAQEWDCRKFAEMMARRNPMLVTDLGGSSCLDDPAFAREVGDRARRDGSSAPVSFVAKVEWHVGVTAELTLGANAVTQMLRLVPRRLPYGRSFALASGTHVVRFEPSEYWSWRGEADALVIGLPVDGVPELCGQVAARRGAYRWERLPGLALTVVPSEVKDHDGNVTEVVG